MILYNTFISYHNIVYKFISYYHIIYTFISYYYIVYTFISYYYIVYTLIYILYRLYVYKELNGFKYCAVTLKIQGNISHLFEHSSMVYQFYFTYKWDIKKHYFSGSE